MPFEIIAKTSRFSGETAGEAREVAGALLRIGRGADSDLLLDDPAVEFNHAAIQEISGVYVLRSLSEGEPTFVNDKPAKEVILTSKGTMRIGPYLLEFSRPTMKSPLRIEWKHLRETPPAGDTADASATLVLQVSPFAGTPESADPDATKALPPVAASPKQDPDKTMALAPVSAARLSVPADPDKTMVLTPPPSASQPVDPDATQKIDPAAEPKRDDPDKTMVIPPPK
jgi:pSer/pThr/pTyr-binding forkhead associated (FHA) protein